MITLINNDFRDVLKDMNPVHMVFADPPDNIDLGYGEYVDLHPEAVYRQFLKDILILGTLKAEILWVSYNAIHTHLMGYLIYCFFGPEAPLEADWEIKHFVQAYTFGQHNQHDIGNNHRPLVRLMRKGTTLYPDAVRIPSWRQLHGDKRADPRGKVPGSVFDFSRVTGNSGQRRNWHPTQLNEGLYERCIRLTCKPEDIVCDLFAGTGTLARVCKTTGNPCVLIEIDAGYCEKIAHEHRLEGPALNTWKLEL
jgi:DNA modification methylase